MTELIIEDFFLLKELIKDMGIEITYLSVELPDGTKVVFQ